MFFIVIIHQANFFYVPPPVNKREGILVTIGYSILVLNCGVLKRLKLR